MFHFIKLQEIKGDDTITTLYNPRKDLVHKVLNTFLFLLFKQNVDVFQGCNSQYACQNSPDQTALLGLHCLTRTFRQATSV